jgi:hypothetical protein
MAYVKATLRQNVMDHLKADAVLSSLLDGDPNNRLRGSRWFSQVDKATPFVVVMDGTFRETNRFKVPGERHGVQPLHFDAHDLLPSSQAVEDILNRIAALLRQGNGGNAAVSDSTTRVHIVKVLDGYQEFYDEAVKLSGKRLTVEFTVRMIES